MDEHKQFKRPSSRPASIDGFVSSGQYLGGSPTQPYSPNRGAPTPSLGGLIRGADGFRPRHSNPSQLGRSRKSELAEVEALLDEPIVLDDIDTKSKKKRRIFGAKHPGRRLVLKRAMLTFMALFLIGGGYFAVKAYVINKNLFRGGGKAPALAQDISQLKGEGDGRVNILLLGVGGPRHTGGDLADTVMLASIDPVNHTVALLSIPRDLWVKIPGDGNQKLNASFAYGKQRSKAKSEADKVKAGIELADKALEPVLGINIHYHAVVNFDAFKQTVNALGGVKVNVPENLYDPTVAWENKGNPYVARKGIQTFDGQRALLYARSRETSSDFARGERQRLLLIAIKDKVFSAGTFSNPIKISNLMSSLGNNIYTDFSNSDVKRLHQIISKTSSSNIHSLDLVKPPHNLLTTANVNGLSVVQPRAGAFDYDAIHNYVRNALRDGFIAKENAKVAVYNATDTVGLAAKQSDTLKSYGYNITTVSSTATPANPPKTKVVDLSKGAKKYTKHYLQERFKTTATTVLPTELSITPPPGTSFVIILGEDVANTLQN